MKNLTFCLSFLYLILNLTISASEEITFSTKPSVKKEGENYKISFAVSKSTDIEISVVDSLIKSNILFYYAPFPMCEFSPFF
ncbi:hypothetical protein IT399_00550 [Candidatus Nomurabacteria bacterium]|nr:hypothetical protein [Candidatus Nomurabacteria bacterium]